MSCGAASATRNDCGSRVGAGRLSSLLVAALRSRVALAARPLVAASPGVRRSPPLAPQPPGWGGEASWPARAPAGAPSLAFAVHRGQPAPRSVRSRRPFRPAFSRHPPPPYSIGPSPILLSRSARAPGPKEKDQGQEGQSPKKVSLVPQHPALSVSSGTSSRVARLGRTRSPGGSPSSTPPHGFWAAGRVAQREPCGKELGRRAY